MNALTVEAPRAVHCEVCRKPIRQPGVGHPRRYCGNACKCKSYRNRAIVRLARKLEAIAEKLENDL